ncbi:MAG: nitroreductase family deazaflavin-dependent oxidoreductase [Chloroflexi bacterium]|nr:nitroreductase family deazaflavin-dependent oxidoreductase [Chloroflexota bacterium]
MSPMLRKMFKFLNRYFMVPLFKLGLGPFLANPLTGYIMVLQVIGRKTGRIRYAPVNYAIHRGQVYFISGGRKSSDWYQNILAKPDIEVILPGGAIYGHAVEEGDPEVRRLMIRQVLKNAGFAGFFEGYNPFKITDVDLVKKTADLPLFRIQPVGLGNGASDQKGWFWVWTFLFTLAILLLLFLK